MKAIHSENSDNDTDDNVEGKNHQYQGNRRARSRHFDKNGRMQVRSSQKQQSTHAKKRRNYYSPIQKSSTIDQPSFNYNIERSSAGNTGKTESGGSDNERACDKKYQTQAPGILDDMEEDKDTKEYKEGANINKP